MVDKDEFEEIEENPWTDMEVTVMKGTIRRGMHFYSIAVYDIRNV